MFEQYIKHRCALNYQLMAKRVRHHPSGACGFQGGELNSERLGGWSLICACSDVLRGHRVSWAHAVEIDFYFRCVSGKHWIEDVVVEKAHLPQWTRDWVYLTPQRAMQLFNWFVIQGGMEAYSWPERAREVSHIGRDCLQFEMQFMAQQMNNGRVDQLFPSEVQA